MIFKLTYTGMSGSRLVNEISVAGQRKLWPCKQEKDNFSSHKQMHYYNSLSEWYSI